MAPAKKYIISGFPTYTDIVKPDRFNNSKLVHINKNAFIIFGNIMCMAVQDKCYNSQYCQYFLNVDKQ